MWLFVAVQNRGVNHARLGFFTLRRRGVLGQKVWAITFLRIRPHTSLQRKLRSLCKSSGFHSHRMADEEEIAVYDEVEIEDMTFDEALQIYHYPCPCGDKFSIALADLQDESTDIAVCPSCSLMIRVIYDMVGFICRFAVPTATGTCG